MRFSFITTVLAFAFTVSAAALDKRDTPTCINSLAIVSSQLTVVNNSAAAYTLDKGYAGFLVVHNQEQNLESKITSASSSSACCIGTVFNITDAQTIIAKVDPITTQFETALATIIAKKPVFDSLAIFNSFMKLDINNLNNKTDTFLACLLASTPSDLIPTAQGYIDRIHAALTTAITAYA